MVEMVADKLGEVEALCRRHKVRRLELFGSALSRDRFDADRSDLDFLVEFLPLGPGEHAETTSGCSKVWSGSSAAGLTW